MSEAGYNDIPLSARLPVPLSTVRVPFAQIADAAVELLNRRPDDGASVHRVAAPHPHPTTLHSTTKHDLKVIDLLGTGLRRWAQPCQVQTGRPSMAASTAVEASDVNRPER